MKTKRKLCSVLLIFSMALSIVLAGCGTANSTGSTASTGQNGTVSSGTDAASKPVTLTWGAWGNAQDFAAFEEMAKGVDKAVPGVEKIELVQYPSTTDFWNSLPSQVAAGTAPDMVLPTDENAYEYITGGLFLPLDKQSMDLTNISEDGIRIWTVNDKLYGMPIDMQPTCLLLNLDVWKANGLTEADYPKSWDDVERIAAKISKPADNFYGLCLNMESTFNITQVVQGFGGGWGEGKTIDSPENIEAINWTLDMFRKGYAISPKQLGDDWEGATFSKNKVAMAVGGVWFHGLMKAAAPNTKYIALPIPQKDQNKKASSLHSDAIVILKSCKNVTLASKAAAYLGRPEAQEIRMNGTGNIPSNTTLVDKYYETHEVFKSLRGMEKFSIPFGYPAKTEKFQTTFINQITKVLYDKSNKLTAEEILKTVADSYDK